MRGDEEGVKSPQDVSSPLLLRPPSYPQIPSTFFNANLPTIILELTNAAAARLRETGCVTRASASK